MEKNSLISAVDEFAQVVALSEAVKRKEINRGNFMNLLTLDGGGIRGLVLIQVRIYTVECNV